MPSSASEGPAPSADAAAAAAQAAESGGSGAGTSGADTAAEVVESVVVEAAEAKAAAPAEAAPESSPPRPEGKEDADGAAAAPQGAGPAGPARGRGKGGAKGKGGNGENLGAKIREAQAKAKAAKGRGKGGRGSQSKGAGRSYRSATQYAPPWPWFASLPQSYTGSHHLQPESILGDWADSLGNAVTVFSTCAYEAKLMAALSQPPRPDIHLKISLRPDGTWMCGNATLDPTWSTESQLHWLTGDGRISVWVRPQAAARAAAAGRR